MTLILQARQERAQASLAKKEVSVDARLSTWLVSSENSTVDKVQSKSPCSISSVNTRKGLSWVLRLLMTSSNHGLHHLHEGLEVIIVRGLRCWVQWEVTSIAQSRTMTNVLLDLIQDLMESPIQQASTERTKG